jgi:ABC-2 type transport system ATP-binding protein
MTSRSELSRDVAQSRFPGDPATSDPVLQLTDVTKYFGTRKVLDKVTLEVKPGEVLGFLGPNGAGKTTTIKIATGFLRFDYGTVTICGHDLKKEYEKALSHVGGIVENPEMYKDLTGRQNLQLYARLQGSVPKNRIDEVLHLVGLENRADEKVRRYSLGMRQRICLAQALLHKPKLLILDEPTNGLDPAGIRKMRDMLRQLAHGQQVGILVSSHQLAEMQLMCDRVVIVNVGKVSGEFQVDSLMNSQTAERRFLFRVSPDDLERSAAILKNEGADVSISPDNDAIEVFADKHKAAMLLRILVNAPVDVFGMETKATSLEQAFLEITGGGNTIE